MDVKRVTLALCMSLISVSIMARPLTDNERAVVENVIKEELKDPDSAKFYHADFPYDGKFLMYCGLVNSKNSYGGYAGKSLFSVAIFKNTSGEDKAMSFDFSSDGSPSSQEVIAAQCAGAGYDVAVKRYLSSSVNKSRKKNGIPPLSKSLIID